MTRLCIDMPDASSNAGETTLQTIVVSHLVMREVLVGVDPTPLEKSPGVLFITPKDSKTRILVDSTAFNLQPGEFLAASGRSEKTAIPSVMGENRESTGGTLRMIELNAVINDSWPLIDQLDTPTLLDFESSEKVTGLLAQLTFRKKSVVVAPEGTDIADHLAAAQLVAMLFEVAGKSTQSMPMTDDDRKLALLRKFMLQNLDHAITIPEMASHLGMSRSAFCLWARNALGETPMRYLRRLCLERGQELMAQDAGDIEEIASWTGFSDRSHFSRQFKEHFGISPAQHQKMCRTAPKTDWLVRVADHFRHNQFERALAVCEEGLRLLPANAWRDQLQFEKGRCLQALGRTAEAIAEWKALHGTSFGYPAGLERCRALFAAEDYRHALEVLRLLYAEADESQRREVIHLWMDHASALGSRRLAGPAEAYLAARAELFIRDRTSMTLTAEILRAMGKNNETLKDCAELPFYCFTALRRAGRLDEAISLYSAHIPPSHIQASLILYGRYEEALALNVETPSFCAEALAKLGRPEEAIRRYPKDCGWAYIALGRYRQLLDHVPKGNDSIAARVYALHALGRTQDLENYSTQQPWQWVLAQLYSNPQAVLLSQISEAHLYRPTALLLALMGALRTNNEIEAQQMLKKIPSLRSPELWLEDHNLTELLIVTVIRGLLGDRKCLQADLKEILSGYRFKFQQSLWHDAAYLTGDITEAEYRRQPCRLALEARLIFIKAVKQDLRNQNGLARQDYNRFLLDTKPYPIENLLRHRFAEWRAQQGPTPEVDSIKM